MDSVALALFRFFSRTRQKAGAAVRAPGAAPHPHPHPHECNYDYVSTSCGVVYTWYLVRVLHPCLILCFHCAYSAVSGDLVRFFTLTASWLLARVMFFLLHTQNKHA